MHPTAATPTPKPSSPPNSTSSSSSSSTPTSTPTSTPRTKPARAPIHADETGEPAASTTRDRLAVVSVTLGIFVIVTSEIMPIGLLTSIGSDFRVSDGTAGLLMTVPGFVAAVAAPVVTVATGRFDRRLMLAALTLVLALANFVAAMAPNLWVMLLSRALVGLTIGGYWSIGAGLAGRLVRERSVGRATAVIFAAVPLGSVIGVPAGTLIGHLAGWRASFVVMGVLSVGVWMALLAFVPPLMPVQVTRLIVLRGLLGRTDVRIGLVATLLVVVAHFGTYTYVTPFLQDVTHVDSGRISTFLLVYGAAGIAGNFLAGAAIARSLRATFAGAALVLAGATALLPVAGRSEVGALGLLVVWGVAYGAVPVCSATWFARSAPHAQEAATVLFTSSFQATIGVGALLGGMVVDAMSVSSVMVGGGAMAAVMALLVWALGTTPGHEGDVPPPTADRHRR
ncbi:MFS transporter [Streptomyces sp. SID3343]|uniref:MFS transporter n=1 Tax=Streptomyces sp. SID3343 TaxID=2690260 RepID=UPI00136ED779|nr:MFS transporter [Streptomyces sp. SID3343]MYW00844.1 MFS transporter [Streptomyces sp. SID3343]